MSIEFSDANNTPILIDELRGFDRRAGKFKFDATWSFFLCYEFYILWGRYKLFEVQLIKS